MKEDLAVNNINEIYSIINGTANYILTRMSEEGKEFSEVLQDAQKEGYAEADPTFDIEGIDSAHKISILSSIAFSTVVPMDKVFVNIEKYGNASAASIPIAMAEAYQSGKLKKGEIIALSGFGAGLTWASCIMKWAKED